MPADIIMPKLGLTMEEGTVVRWLAREGEHIVQGAPLLEVETDKVVVEVEAPASGVIGAIQVREGEKAPVGALLAHLYAADEEATGKSEERRRQMPRKIFSSPRARRRARDFGLDWRTLAGSGPQGRVIERDVLAAGAAGTEGRRKKEEGKPGLPPAFPGKAAEADSWQDSVYHSSPSSVAAPQLHLSVEVGAGALLEMCARLSPSIEKRTGVQLTTTDLLIRICGAALARVPRANARWEDGHLSLLPQVNIGLAAAAGQAGPVPPMIPDAGNKPLSQIASERTALLERARQEMPTSANLLAPHLQSASLTLVDLGIFRVDRVQAVLSPPQTAILTVGRIAERPSVVEGRLAVRQTAFLMLSCDSRVFDAVLAAQFLDCIVDLIEEPYGLLI